MIFKNPRIYGNAPFEIAVIHGGPGAPGEMAPVAQRLSSDWGIIEPFQTEITIAGQLEELGNILERYANLPVALIGFSWGAWLSFLFAAKYPKFVKKLILIGSGPFEERYAGNIMKTRSERLSKEDQAKVDLAMKILNDQTSTDRDRAFANLGELLSKADDYDPIANVQEEPKPIDCNVEIFQNTWAEAGEMRRSGRLLEFGNLIHCQVAAIHGDYDPHPAGGVEKPLYRILKDFRFILLKECGHKPWIERQARDEFYRILKNELR
jgi:pimeloyl-ACP methyl ester carboxylesterase